MTGGESMNSFEKLGFYVFLIMLVPVFVTLSFAGNDSQEGFKKRIEVAFQSKDKKTAIGALFYKDNLNEEMLAMVNGSVASLMKKKDIKISFEPVMKGIPLVFVIDGYEYGPNVDVAGYVNFDNPDGSSSKVPYGQASDGRYYFSTTIKKLVNKDAKQDKQIQVVVIGIAESPIKFKGWCKILHSDGKVQSHELGGTGSQTLIIRGQEIKTCEVENYSKRGDLSVSLIVGEDEIFNNRINEPETRLSYP